MEMPPEFEEALSALKVEFLKGAKERLDDIESSVGKIQRKEGDRGDIFHSVKQHAHDMKGSAGSYGLHLLSAIAERFDKYLLSSNRLDDDQLLEVGIFVAEMRKIVDAGEEPDEADHAAILSSLPTNGGGQVVLAENGTVLVVVEANSQRDTLEKTLSSCGFTVSFEDAPVKSVETAIALKPRAILADLDLPETSGLELADMLASMSATKHIPFAVIIPEDRADIEGEIGERTIGVIQKGPEFVENVVIYLKDCGLFEKAEF